ncbi:MAG TPA: VOC family protein [Candidatus Dormibacteraeota bacterium]|nr:VOC family protein [Candidatus Dormibacteraeota bacterium]
MEVKELGHLVLYVHDIRRSAAFYGEVLGWKRISPEGLPVAAFSSGRTHHELLLIEVGPNAAELPSGRRVGLYHFGLKVADSDQELKAVLEHIQAQGVKLVGTADHTVTHSLYIEDPDGNEIELYSDVAGVDWQNDPHLLLAPVRPLSL